MKPIRIPRKKDGTTLVEIMLGIALLAILVVVFLSSLFYPRWLNTSCMFKQQAVQAGTDAIERLFALPYTAIATGNQSLMDFSDRYRFNDRSVVQTVYSADRITPGSGVEYLHITVEVAWPGSGDSPVVLETYRSSLKEYSP